MKILPEKRLELSQTLTSLSGSIKMEKGCRRCDFCQGIEDENRLFLLEEWDTEENLMTHLKSDHFRVLQGAMNLLREPCEMTFHTVFRPAKMANAIDPVVIQTLDKRLESSYKGTKEKVREGFLRAAT